MQDGLSSVNELVEKAAAANKSGQSNDNNGAGGGESGEGSGGDGGGSGQDGSGAGTSGTGAADQGAAAKNAGGASGGDGQEQKPDLLKQILEEHQFESIDQLRAHLSKKDEKQKSPEEEKRDRDIYEANLVSYAVENSLISLEDVTRYNVIKGKSDEDLVYESFVSENEDDVKERLQAERKDADDDTPVTDADVMQRLNEDFEREYPTTSENEKARQKALNKLSKAAKELRGPVEAAYTAAKSKYDDVVGVRQAYPGYKKAIDEVVASVVPKKYSFFSHKDGDEEVSVDLDISEDDRKQIMESVSKKVENPVTYSMHRDGKSDDIAKLVKREADLLLWEKYNEAGKKLIAEKFVEIGKKKGSDIGAKQSFETNQAKKGSQDGSGAVNAEQSVIDSTRKK